MFQFKKLAIAGAITASLMGVSVAEAAVSYHLSTTGGEAPNTNGSGNAPQWTNGTPAALGYAGNLPVTWMADINIANTNNVVSAADAIANHGAATSFVLQSLNNKWKPASSWGNAMDYGLINLQVAGDLTITVEADSSLNSTFAPGFTLWSGWGTGGNKHQGWNANPSAPTSLSMTGINFVDYAATTFDGGSVTKTFNNLAAGKYFLWIGGNGSNNSNEYYKANLSVAAVPVPGAVWLFGTAIAGMIGIGRRKSSISA